MLDAAAEYGRAFPMMMTAAGTIAAAKLFVMGVGVAGLQAIATARRLGAQVSATDVRSATREQILSLGAKPIFVESVAGIEGEGAGGYATEMSDEYKAAQAELVSEHIAKQDIVITTALIPGRPAPRLISDAQIATMKPGSVIVDLAVEQGGNVEGAVAGEVVVRHGVRIVGHSNVPSRLAADASALYARNLYNFLVGLLGRRDEGAGLPRRRRDRAGRAADQGRQGRQRAAAGMKKMAARPAMCRRRCSLARGVRPSGPARRAATSRCAARPIRSLVARDFLVSCRAASRGRGAAPGPAARRAEAARDPQASRRTRSGSARTNMPGSRRSAEPRAVLPGDAAYRAALADYSARARRAGRPDRGVSAMRRDRALAVAALLARSPPARPRRERAGAGRATFRVYGAMDVYGGRRATRRCCARGFTPA